MYLVVIVKNGSKCLLGGFFLFIFIWLLIVWMEWKNIGFLLKLVCRGICVYWVFFVLGINVFIGMY